VNSLERPTRRAVAVILGMALVCFEPALADEPGGAEEPSATPSAPPSSPQPAADAPLAPSEAAPNRWADGAAKAFDVFPIRLLSSTAVVVGFGAFVASVPLVGPGFQMEGIRNSWDYFVMGPYEYTFVRPLGDF
jgi:hypothetical protein